MLDQSPQQQISTNWHTGSLQSNRASRPPSPQISQIRSRLGSTPPMAIQEAPTPACEADVVGPADFIFPLHGLQTCTRCDRGRSLLHDQQPRIRHFSTPHVVKWVVMKATHCLRWHCAFERFDHIYPIPSALILSLRDSICHYLAICHSLTLVYCNYDTIRSARQWSLSQSQACSSFTSKSTR